MRAHAHPSSLILHSSPIATSPMPVLIIFGEKTANEVLEAARLGYGERFSRIDKLYYEPTSFANRHLPEIAAAGEEVFFHIGVANVAVKREIHQRCQEAGWRPFAVVHPSAVVSPTARVGEGAFVGPLAVISSYARIGQHSIVHIHASVGHDVVVGDYCAILPGARISGTVTIGDRSLIGSNAFIAAGVTVGTDCQVDALTYVRTNLPDHHIASVRIKGIVERRGESEG